MTLAKTSSELNFHADADHVVVTHCGRTCCKGRKINLSHVFAGQKVGVKLAMPRCADGRTSRTRGGWAASHRTCCCGRQVPRLLCQTMRSEGGSVTPLICETRWPGRRSFLAPEPTARQALAVVPRAASDHQCRVFQMTTWAGRTSLSWRVVVGPVGNVHCRFLDRANCVWNAAARTPFAGQRGVGFVVVLSRLPRGRPSLLVPDNFVVSPPSSFANNPPGRGLERPPVS